MARRRLRAWRQPLVHGRRVNARRRRRGVWLAAGSVASGRRQLPAAGQQFAGQTAAGKVNYADSLALLILVLLVLHSNRACLCRPVLTPLAFGCKVFRRVLFQWVQDTFVSTAFLNGLTLPPLPRSAAVPQQHWAPSAAAYSNSNLNIAGSNKPPLRQGSGFLGGLLGNGSAHGGSANSGSAQSSSAHGSLHGSVHGGSAHGSKHGSVHGGSAHSGGGGNGSAHGSSAHAAAPVTTAVKPAPAPPAGASWQQSDLFGGAGAYGSSESTTRGGRAFGPAGTRFSTEWCHIDKLNAFECD